MRKIIKRFILICMIVAVIFPANLTTIYAEKQTIKVGYLKNYGIVNEPIIQNAVGYGFEYLKEIEKHTNYNFEYVSTDWEKGFELLEQGEIDLFGLAAVTEERTSKYEFIYDPICYEIATLYASKNSSLYANDPIQLEGLTIGVTSGDSHRKVIEDYAELNGIQVNIEEVKNNDFNSAISSGKIDAFLSGSLYSYPDMKIIDELFSTPVYLMANKENAKLCDDIEQAISKAKKLNPCFHEELWEKYYGYNRTQSHSITALERDALNKKDTYTVGYHVDLHPISYRNEDGEPDGYSVDIMNLIAKKLDFNVSYVPLYDENDNAVSDLDFNLCIIADSYYTQRNVSQPYYYHELIVLRKKELSKEDVKHLSALNYATLNIDDHLGTYPNAKIYKISSTTQSMELNKKLDIDGYATLEGRAELILSSQGLDKYTIDYLDDKIPLAITISKNLPIEVSTALDKAILSIPNSTVEEFITKTATDLTPNPTFWDFLIRYSREILLVIFIVVLLYIRIIRINHKKLRNLLEIDQLTGLMSYSKFNIEAKKRLETALPNEYCYISFDVDNFKYINHTYGFETGNVVLCKIADFMCENSHKNTLLCRYRDDIFIVLGKTETLDGLDLNNLKIKTERFQQLLTNEKLQVPLYFSTGIYNIINPNTSLETIGDCARKTRYISKRTHGNKMTIYSDELKKELERQKTIYTSMEQAIKDREFFIVIQPKIDIRNGKLVGGETLVRWKKKDGSFVYPDEFIPLFEQNEFIIHLDQYVFDETCKFVHESKIDMPRISVNISAVTARDENFLQSYLEILNRYNLEPEQFELELTESALSEDFNKILNVVNSAKKAGFHFSIDDFGKGASSLTRIKDLNVDVLKLDREFIPDQHSEREVLVIKNIISMANDLGFTTLAEGIETKEDLELLIDLGCDMGQGYFFSRPLSKEDFLQQVIDDCEV